MRLAKYIVDDTVAILTMNSGDNRFNPNFLEELLEILDEIENKTNVNTLVVTSSHEKIFSNGLDLDWLLPQIEKKNTELVTDFFLLLNRLFKRILTYPMITIAAITGHAFAAGAIMSCAFDFRFMRTDRGYFCLPEVDISMPFLPGMIALLKRVIPLYKFEELQLTGKRLTADECLEHHIITKACHMDTLMVDALAFAKTLNKKRGILREMKVRANCNIIHTLDVDDLPFIQSGKFSY